MITRTKETCTICQPSLFSFVERHIKRNQALPPDNTLAKYLDIRKYALKVCPPTKEGSKNEWTIKESPSHFPDYVSYMPPSQFVCLKKQITIDDHTFFVTIIEREMPPEKPKQGLREVEKSVYLWKKEPVIFQREQPLTGKKPQVLELFCGCGGTSTGFEQAGFEIALGVDILTPAIETFRRNHKTATAILGDVRKVTESMISSCCPFGVDVVLAGIPCQGFSLNNKKRHEMDERNFLYTELLRILRLLHPKAVVVENVSGIKSSRNGAVVTEIETGIREACGLLVSHKILYAHHYGVPQKRMRVVFIGTSKSKMFDFDTITKTHGPGTSRPYVSVRDALSDLPRLKSGERAMNYTLPPQTDYQREMRKKESNALTNHIAPTHPKSTIRRIARTKPGEPMYARFKQRIRLSWDIQSPTQVSGGIRPQFQFGHPEDDRGLTIRERCRLQSFPDHFTIMGGICQGRVQTGNAVPPLLAKAIAKAIK